MELRNIAGLKYNKISEPWSINTEIEKCEGKSCTYQSACNNPDEASKNSNIIQCNHIIKTNNKSFNVNIVYTKLNCVVFTGK